MFCAAATEGENDRGRFCCVLNWLFDLVLLCLVGTTGDSATFRDRIVEFFRTQSLPNGAMLEFVGWIFFTIFTPSFFGVGLSYCLPEFDKGKGKRGMYVVLFSALVVALFAFGVSQAVQAWWKL
jgi:hypothetical protein